jgi:hypothetical protein
MQDFYREIDENININRTFSIDDIADDDKLNRFYIIGEDVKIEPILEDTEFLEVIQKENPQVVIQQEQLIEIETQVVDIANEKTSENIESSHQPENINVFDGMTTQQPVEQPIGLPVEQPIELPVEQPIELPVEQPIEQPVEQPIEQPEN